MGDEASSESTTPPFSAEDALAFMQKMWNPFAMPMPGSSAGAVEPTPEAKPEPAQPWGGAASMWAFPNPAAMFAALDPKEIERRIADLRVIEGWLAMSLNVVQMSVRTLELQRTSLEALQAAHAPVKPKRAAKRRKA